MTVTALLVSHSGASWLPAVLRGIAEQTAPIQAHVAVDTGSKDDSVDLLIAAWGAGSVHQASRSTPFASAIEIGLAAAPETEWVWLLHDDANPAPTALAELLAAAQEHPEADVLGPKLREWPSLRRLLELGVTISGTGQRETGLERGEYDQGQHDDVRRVLAVNTAGMLVRRSLLDKLGGFDPDLPIFGNDIDFGWRAALAGHHTLIVPAAVVFHAEAAHRGLRRTPLTGRHTHFQERRAALFTLLANSSGRALPFRAVRLAFGTMLRAIGFLLVRSVGEALDELAALGAVLLRPGQLLAARRRRADLLRADPASVKPLLAPPWLPYRHGLDLVSDLATAATLQAQDVAERRRAAKLAAEGGPVRTHEPEEGELEDDSGILVRFLTNPVAVLLAGFVLLALVATRGAIGHVSGGALSPAPAHASQWWHTYVQHWHPLLTGTDAPAPAALLPLAGAGAVLGGNAGLVVTLILMLAVPLSMWGAWRFLKVAAHLRSADDASRWLLAWGATVYGLVPVTSGAWGEGRLGTVVTATVLPWLSHAALGFGDPEPDRRWRAAWRTGFLLALAAAFTPVIWLLVAVLAAAALGFAARISPAAVRQRSVWGPPAAAVAIVPVLLLPWVVGMIAHGPWRGLLLELGRVPAAAVSRGDVLLGLVGDRGAPMALGLALVLLAALALVPSGPRLLVIGCWIIVAAATTLALVVSLVRIPTSVGPVRPGVGALAVAVAAALVTAVVLGADELSPRLRSGRQRWLGAAGLVALALLPAAGTWWLLVGNHDRLTTDPQDPVPAYMVDSSLQGSQHGVLIIDGSVADGLRYSVRRDDGTRLGDDEIAALTPHDAAFTQLVQDLVTRPTAATANGLGAAGIEYVVLPGPADGQVAATLDATAGLAQASAEDRTARAWSVQKDLVAPHGPGSVFHTALVVLQLAVIALVLVLCGPTRRRERT